jgi:hypothetical protein
MEMVQRNPVSRLLGGVKETGFLCSILVERHKGLKETRFLGLLGGVKETGFLCSILVARHKGLKETRFRGFSVG